MLRVGLTGGLGSGKSTAADLFAELGVHVIRADEVGRALMEPGQPVFADIMGHFGPVVLREDGRLNREALAELAFRGGRLRELNHIVHPPVIAAQEEWMRQIFAADHKAIAMVESALIFEASGAESPEADVEPSVPGWRERFDRIVLVTAPDEIKIDRYVARLSKPRHPLEAELQSMRNEATLRLAQQIPDDKKTPLSDYVIDNSGSLEHLKQAVAVVFTRLEEEAETHAA